MKKQEREKHLTKYTEQQPKARPTSSRAAHRVTAGEQVDSPPSKSDEDDGKKLAMRRALADCLKREVIDKNWIQNNLEWIPVTAGLFVGLFNISATSPVSLVSDVNFRYMYYDYQLNKVQQKVST